MRIARSTLIGTAVALALFGRNEALHAQAQAASASGAPAEQLQEVQVTGIRYSLTKALEVKRDSVQNVQVISADDIGKLPDQNVADAVQRLPGVNTASQAGGEGGFDENDRVAIRGTSPSLTQTTINGHAVSTGDWFLLDQYQLVGRSVSYTLLPAETVSQVLVSKTQTADMIEGGVAGNVDLRSIRPLELKKDFTAEGYVGAEYGDLAGNVKPQANALLAWKNAASSVGVLVQGFYEERDIQRNGQEILGYQTVASTSAVAIAFPQTTGAAIPSLIGSTLFQQTRERKGGDFDLQLQPSDQLSVDLNGFYAELLASNQNRNYMLWGGHLLGETPTAATVQDGTVTSASWGPATTDSIVYDQIIRPGAKSTSWYLNLDGSYRFTDRFTVTGQVGYTQGVGQTVASPSFEATQNGAISYNMNGVSSPVSVTYGNSASPAGAGFSWAWTDVTKATDSEKYAKVDGLLALDDSGVFQSVKFGVRYSDHSHVIDFPVNGGCLPAPACTTFPTYSGGMYPSNYPGGLGAGPITPVWEYSAGAIEQYVNANVNMNPVQRNYWPGAGALYEKDWAGYAMANIGGPGWAGNFGVRLVTTNEQAIVNVPGGTAPITGSDFGPYTPTPFDNHYLNILPSANLKFDLDRNLVLRFSAAETMARADYSALSGTVALTDLTWTGTGGNPNLQPIRAANYDGALEWYFAPQSLLALSLFYMDFASYVDFGTSTATYYNQTLKQFGLYTITSPFNTTAQDKGFELQYEQPFGKGFGVQANFTHATGSTANGSPLVGMSNQTYNVIGYWENRLASLRLAYTYRSHFLVGLDRSFAENEDDYGELDASVNVNLTRNVSFSLNAMNLTNEILKYYGDTTTQPRAFYQNGRQYYAGFHVKL
jgi:iron complex outermembrane receptor protein